MPERVVSLHLPWKWHPVVPHAVLVSDDLGRAALALDCHPMDEDRRTVVLCWQMAISASLGLPNDEALYTHRLYYAGLKDLMWLGEVEGSTWLSDAVYRRERFRHFIAPLKEGLVEVLADNVTLKRSDKPTAPAAFDAIALPDTKGH